MVSNLFEGIVKYIVSANSFDMVINWGFGATIKRRFHLSDTKYDPNLNDEDAERLKAAKRELTKLIHNKQVIVRAHSTNTHEKYTADVYVRMSDLQGVDDYTKDNKYVEEIFGDRYIYINKLMVGQNLLKIWTK